MNFVVATLYILYLQLCTFFTCNFVHFYLTINNVLLSKGEDDNVNAEWELWYSQMKKYAEINLFDIFNRLNINNVKLKKFLFDCKDAMYKDDIDKLNEAVIKREISIKGEKRSKLRNNEFEYKGWTGIGRLQYRLRNAQNIIRDIYEGLGDEDA